MRWIERSKAGGILLAAVLAGQPCPAQEKPRPLALAITMLQCGHLIDTLDGKLLGPTLVTIMGDHITAVASSAGKQASPGANVVDLRDATCMPGLSDMHVHLSQQSDLNNSFVEEMTLNESEWVVRSTVYARRKLMAGFTTVRDLGDLNYEVLGLRNGINAG